MRSGKVTYRLIIFLIALIFGITFSIPSFLQTDKGAKINLGLDLQGGLHMLLGVETEVAIHSKIKSIAGSINYYAKKEDILLDKLRTKDENIEFSLIDADETQNIDAMLKTIKGIVVEKKDLHYTLSLSDEEKAATIEYAIAQAVETIRNRLDQFGLAEPTVARQGSDKILVELPGIKTSEDEQRARDLIAKAAHLQLMAVDDKRQDRALSMSKTEAESYGDIIYPDSKNSNIKYVLKSIPILDGSMLTDARVAFSQQNNMPIINFSLNSEGARIFGDFTGSNVGNRLAIVLDGKVYSAPVINERIGGGSGQISGGFTVEEAHDVAIALRSGALLAPVKMLEKRSIGPSLGAESIQKSMIALMGASLLIVLFMIVYYGFSGVLANIALIANIIILVAIMALFGATLTLPGMAGIVLTIGMAVDANVIINERIRELLRDGASIKVSVQKGYENAMSAIVDANITTLITVVALYAYGTGPVKGFAVTMSIGILVSMLTAILGTHGFFDFLMDKIEKSKSTRLWFGYKRD
ncbi:protein-export membrane protein SecD [Campylobacter pinnipediorum subsp. caledonicus]|uniref:Protein translocase subunit SecD n=1 Tax=Campylobacter pinnipediorum subsp. caledonicus TaxID=1874362 RepID=A0A1S6U9W4_9BACT|nr:protein translocase subunit SecD [Campylobacter pinnipediorum]AQW86844.1 protein-export membrane protein SecD [Campylobacter pinnipediorum subsp. caledonicus]AQW88499.1 protein-export membrane protein SecD [Campylobacter pinnipediorum subsp. caledonicus]OPA71048.1 protein-export membrane protein SecD [Campylobacter pinnipediorum subsp. caledonicus]